MKGVALGRSTKTVIDQTRLVDRAGREQASALRVAHETLQHELGPFGGFGPGVNDTTSSGYRLNSWPIGQVVQTLAAGHLLCLGSFVHSHLAIQLDDLTASDGQGKAPRHSPEVPCDCLHSAVGAFQAITGRTMVS